jgi:tetratricopeptide (TPR) repeat protein
MGQENSHREVFAARLGELHRAAGSPLLGTVAERASRRRSQHARWHVTAKRISDWNRGRNVPESGEALAAVTRTLIEMARSRIRPNEVTQGLYDETQWQRWWRAARSEPLASSDPAEGPDHHGLAIQGLDPIHLEVHASIEAGEDKAGSGALPLYVKREHDDWLAKVVSDANAGESQLAVLVGDSSTGKTRACWEAIQNLPSSWRLWHPIQPSRPEAAAEILNVVGSHTVLWLNEIDRYLLTPESGIGEYVAVLITALLRDPRRRPVLVLGTIWPEYWAILATEPSAAGERDLHAQARALLTGRSRQVSAEFSGRSYRIMQAAALRDPRLAEALANAHDGHITQYLAGVPVLLERYDNAPSPARALIDAAIDARRLGHSAGLPRALLEAAAPFYMTDQQWDELGEDWFDKAITYTTAPCRGVRGPLTRFRPRMNGDSVPGVTFYKVPDYLEQLGRAVRKDFTPGTEVWDIYARFGTFDSLAHIASEAAARALPTCALKLWIAAADSGDRYALWQAASILQELGRPDEALGWYQRLADDGDVAAFEVAARMLQDFGRPNEALDWYKEAAELGDAFALHEAVELLCMSDRADEASRWIDVLQGSDQIAALRHLAWLAATAGQTDRAILLYQRALDAGDTDIESEIARMLERAGRIDEALAWYLRAADSGDLYAARLAGRMLQETGNLDDALAWFDRGGSASDFSCFLEAARMLSTAGRLDQALLWFRRAVDAGDVSAAWQAARALESAGRIDEALAWFAEAARDHGTEPLREAVAMLHRAARGKDTVKWLQDLAEPGSDAAMGRVITMLREVEDDPRVLTWLGRMAENGSRVAGRQSIRILLDAHRVDDALVWFQRAADWGDWDALSKGAETLCRAGRVDEALMWFERAVEGGDRDALSKGAETLLQAGRADEALAWFQRAAEGGDRRALRNAARILEELGRTDEALNYYKSAATYGDHGALISAVRLSEMLGLDDGELRLLMGPVAWRHGGRLAPYLDAEGL